MPWENEVEQHVDEQQWTDFQPPEADHADRGFEKKAEQKRHDERQEKARHDFRRRPAIKKIAADVEHECKRQDRKW